MVWLLALFITLPAMSARAHAILEDSTPAAGATIKAGKLDLRFRYNSRIDQSRSRLILIRPDNAKTPVAISTGTPPDIIGASLELPAGHYVIRWQVLATDGHITRGDVPFTVTAP
jgi:copper resistance protein C